MTEKIKSPSDKGVALVPFRQHEGDTGSAPVQIALLTKRINQLSEHLKQHKKDHTSRRGLLKMIGKRSTLLKYIHRTDLPKYQEVIRELGLRK